LNTVYLGTSAFAAAVLGRLAGSPHRPRLVVTRPDRPRGRGRRLQPPPVAEAARALGLALAQPERAGDALAAIEAAEPETLCVCAYGELIREPLLSLRPILNVHPSLLPRWRGAAPLERAIMAGDEQTGVSIMRLTAGLDSGPVCLAAPEPIGPGDDFGALAARLQQLGGELLVRALEERPPCAEQDEAGVTYAEKIGPQDRTLHPARPARELERTVRALRPHIGARLALPGAQEWLGVHAARVAAAGPPLGRLVLDEGRVLLGCAEGALELLEVRPAGGRAMTAVAWARGRPGVLQP